MQFFATTDAAGLATGFYHPDIHGDAIPAGAIPISAETHAAWIRDTARQRWTGEGLEPYDPPPPPPVVPREVTNFQARALLMGMPSPTAGRTMFDDVDDTLRARGGVAWQAWEYANTLQRNGALVRAMAEELGFTPGQLDALFVQAAAIEA